MCHSADIFVEREPTKPSTMLVWKCNLGVCVYTTGSNWGCTKAWRCIWVCWMMRCGQWQLSTHWQHVYHMIMTSVRWKQLSSRRSLCSNLWLSSSLVEETHLCTSWSHFWKSSRSCFFSLSPSDFLTHLVWKDEEQLTWWGRTLNFDVGLLDSCSKSVRLNTSLAVSGLTPLLVARLDHQDAIARLLLLKMIKVCVNAVFFCKCTINSPDALHYYNTTQCKNLRLLS